MEQKIIKVIYEDRTEYRLGTKDGPLHRLNGPAWIREDGSQAWWVGGKRHRLDGPAYFGSNGHQSWYIEGQLHRLDGPAWIGFDGTQAWYVEDKRLDWEQENIAKDIIIDMSLEDTMLYIGDPILCHFVKERLDKENSHRKESPII